MGRWKQAKQCIIDVGLVGRGANLKTTELIVANHNADCAAYEARIAELEALVRRVKSESLRVVELPDEGNLHDWYMTPTGLGYPGKDRKQNNCIESAEGYYRLDECKPVRLERWETAE